MAKLVEIVLDDNKVPIKHTYEAKDGRRFSARYAAIAEAAADGHDEFEASTLGKMLREREANQPDVSVTLRLPRALHQQAQEFAMKRGLSLNKFILEHLMKELGQ